MIFLIMLIILVPCFVLAFSAVSLQYMLQAVLKALPLLLLAFVALVMYGKHIKARERKGCSKEAQLFLNMLQTHSSTVKTPQQTRETSWQYARKLKIPTDDESLREAYRKGFAELTAVQDEAFRAKFPNDKAAEAAYLHQTQGFSHRDISLARDQLKSKLYVRLPEFGAIWVREELFARRDNAGQYLKQMLGDETVAKQS